jgi:hypothetical protein
MIGAWNRSARNINIPGLYLNLPNINLSAPEASIAALSPTSE